MNRRLPTSVAVVKQKNWFATIVGDSRKQSNKTSNKLPAHELKLRVNRLICVRKQFLILLEKIPPPLLQKIYPHEIFLLIQHFQRQDNLYWSKLS
jgi:hypothetical protein